jgi:hypothetical protein
MVDNDSDTISISSSDNVAIVSASWDESAQLQES